jgi:hypothetical protein
MRHNGHYARVRLAVVVAGLLLTAALCGCGDDDSAATDPFCAEAEQLVAEGLAAFERGDDEDIPTNADVAKVFDRMAALAPSSLDSAFEVLVGADLTDPAAFTDPQIRSAVADITDYAHSHCDVPSTSSTPETARVERCTELLPEGTILRDDMFDLYCVGTNGIADVQRTEIRQCSDGRSLYLSDLGWGYLGEPWHTSEPPAAELASCGR